MCQLLHFACWSLLVIVVPKPQKSLILGATILSGCSGGEPNGTRQNGVPTFLLIKWCSTHFGKRTIKKQQKQRRVKQPGVLLQYQKALPQCPLLPQYCSNTLQWALPQCCCNIAIAAALPQYCCNTVLLQYCRNGAIAAIRCAHCSNPQYLNALPQHCGNDLLPQRCSNAFGHCRLPESTRAVCSFRRAALEP